MINEWVEAEREAIGIWQRLAEKAAEISDDTSLSYVCINVDSAALQIESAIYPWFRGFKSTSECMRGRLRDPLEPLLLSVKILIEKCDMWGVVSDTRKRFGTSRVRRLNIQKHVTCSLKPRAYLDSHSPPGHRPTFTVNEHCHRSLQSKPRMTMNLRTYSSMKTVPKWPEMLDGGSPSRSTLLLDLTRRFKLHGWFVGPPTRLSLGVEDLMLLLTLLLGYTALMQGRGTLCAL